MPSPLTHRSRLLRAILDPSLLLWAVGHGLTWPTRTLRSKAYWKKRRAIPHGKPAQPFDPAAIAAIHARQGPHLVFLGHGAGEFNMIRRVADALREVRPEVKLSVALRNNDAIDSVRSRHPGLNVSYWSPDGYLGALRWLASQRPDVLAIVEAHRQPALVRAAATYGARVVLVNGRVKERKAFRSPLRRPFVRWLFRGYAAMSMISERHRQTVLPLVSPRCDLRTNGDLKTDVRPPTLSPERAEGLERWLDSDLPVVGAGSTENLDEERMVVVAFLRVRKRHPCRLMLAPRLQSVESALLDLLRESGLTVSRRSKDDPPADVLLLDTMFELSTAYRACNSAYVGGAFVKGGGGHNVLEPYLWRVPVAYGLERGNFEAVQLLVEERGAGVRIRDAEELAAFWLRFLSDPAERNRIGEQGHAVLEENRGAVSRTIALLGEILDAASR